MAKPPEVYDKLAIFHEGKAKKAWAKAKNGAEGYYYAEARKQYGKAKMHAQTAERLRRGE
ncbi:hypothetical protein [Moraxella nasicaprae]|uniref:Uncharacterized protein n=1 Tax=Moraxella nasicaprae TaxID=2904122 RepID=A0ABY6F3M1_9GAMM|nr:hypothetical protein [Moraxella nasicaprae]UXZ04681.1 hypothetical protein LU297_08960 [Moraxella nasicaprae]